MPQVLQPQNNEDTREEALNTAFTSLRKQEKEDLAKIAADKAGMPYINLHGSPISPDTIALLPRETAERTQCIVFARAGNNIRVAAIDPFSPLVGEVLAQLEANEGLKSEVFMMSQGSFDAAMQYYGLVVVPKVIKGVELSPEEISKAQAQLTRINDLKDAVVRMPVTELLAGLIGAAMNFRATDIHFETEENEVRVRFRIDGILHLLAALPKDTWNKIATRIKTLAKLKINVSTVPQDGTFAISTDKQKIDVRVSVLPTNYGESIAMRLLMSSTTEVTFEMLGLRGQAFELLQKEIARPNGMIITTGPTGAGKTTTLYSILRHLNSEEQKIITLEDPIEYKIPGIIQSQIETKKEYTFASGLRSILRQDPDVVMVGEIRDLPTADTAVQASLTGHLVLSTIHTNSASGAIPRFLSLGVKPFLLSPALNIIIGQRLVRRVCEQCKTKHEVSAEELERAKNAISKMSSKSGYAIDPNTLNFYKGNGCDRCHGIGFFGRIAIFEVLHISPTIQELINSTEMSEFRIQEAAIQEGMITMLQDGVLKANDGLTTLEEVFRVTEE